MIKNDPFLSTFDPSRSPDPQKLHVVGLPENPLRVPKRKRVLKNLPLRDQKSQKDF